MEAVADTWNNDRLDELSLRVEGGFDRLDRQLHSLRTEFRTETTTHRTETKDEFSDLRTEMKAEFVAFRAEMKEEFAAVRAEMREEFAAVRAEMKEGFEKVDARFERVDERFQAIDARFVAVEGSVAELRAETAAGFVTLQRTMLQTFLATVSIFIAGFGAVIALMVKLTSS